MVRRLPNAKNGFLGHGVTVATVVAADSPKTVERTILATGETEAITVSSAYAETFDAFRAADRSRPHSQVLRELLDSGVTLQTRAAAYRALGAS